MYTNLFDNYGCIQICLTKTSVNKVTDEWERGEHKNFRYTGVYTKVSDTWGIAQMFGAHNIYFNNEFPDFIEFAVTVSYVIILLLT